ncbi:prepilin-type N-terminal cleavage/methylation domain-containing protein [Vibrio kanaloae]|uniref:type IV pilin protein n=1 Tax=Vibrio kanaloae TaxID=170673 RepID=UPI000C860597|nr:type IV pilin protein [Vibrio kanaloae]PMM02177.1 prepilin-type N-terminal cleavage/methylation domain-containing protein [Vibrio kanaloae]
MIRKNKCNNNNLSIKGMTLIELLLTVIIIGVLGAIAYPSYTNHVIKAHRVTAMADMTKIQLEMETLYTGNYASAAAGIISGGTCLFCETDTNRYTLAVSASSTTYSIQAEPHSPQTNDDCLDSTTDILELYHSGISEPEACWK